MPAHRLRRLVPLSFCALLSLASAAVGQNPVLRIMPVGDSITEGALFDDPDGSGGYRGPLYNLLTAAGYQVDYVGTRTVNSELLVEKEHQGHGGWRIDQLYAQIGNALANVADPDIVLLQIGTNDFGQGYAIDMAIDRLDALVLRIATLRPWAHIIVSNLTERGEPYNSWIQTHFNPFVQQVVDDHVAAGRRVSFLDLRAAVPYSHMPDTVHPNQAGYERMAAAWFGAIQAVVGPQGDTNPPAIVQARGSIDRRQVAVIFSRPVADSAANPANFALDGGVAVESAVLDAAKRVVTLTTAEQAPGTLYQLGVSNVADRRVPVPGVIAPGTTATFTSALPRGCLHRVPESADYTLVYSLDVPAVPNLRTVAPPYSIDNRAAISGFDRVAYYVELQKPGGDLQYMWASMDAFTTDVGRIGVPTLASGAVFQQNVANLNVVTNVRRVPTGNGLTGNLEFWPTDYSESNATGVPGATNWYFDAGDTRLETGSSGSMQLHHPASGRTYFAFNNWGHSGAFSPAGLGLGSQLIGSPDWTYISNADGYAIKTIQVLVRAAGDAVAPAVESAVATHGGSRVVVTFSEPLAAASVAAAGFALDHGVAVLNATLSEDLRRVVLDTTPQPAGVPLTLSIGGVRDCSPNANRIAAGTTVVVAAPALPPEVVANVGAAANGYQLVCSIDVPVSGNFNSSNAAYRIDDRGAAGPFTRVAYYLELEQPGQPAQFVWAAMDAFTVNRRRLGVPTTGSGVVFQRPVSNLEVISNVAGVVNGSGLTGGNIEFWPGASLTGNSAAVPDASGSSYDFGDQPAPEYGLYGSMQVHNHEAAQTLFAINRFGVDGGTLDIGIGNQAAGHPDWTYAANATGYTRRVLHVLVLPGPSAPAAVLARVPEAAVYQPLASVNLPAAGNLSGGAGFPGYAVDYRAETGPFSRVAYYLELKRSADPEASYVWASMDAFSADPAKVCVPNISSGARFQQNVAGLNVASNVPGVVTGSGIATGNIEFWPGDYIKANDAAVAGASDSSFDFGDSAPGTGPGYGSMQVHNHGAGQTVFAINNWGTTHSTWNSLCLGIGNQPTGEPDWTFANNAANWDETRVLHILTLAGDGDASGPVILGATGSADRRRVAVTFNEPLADSAANPANFALDGGLAMVAAVLSADRRSVILTTGEQVAGQTYTVGASGVRDRSAAGNPMATAAGVPFTAYAPPAVLAQVAEATQYTPLYQLDIPAGAPGWNAGAVPYRHDESKFGAPAFDRAAYLLELDGEWLWVSFDAFTGALAKLGVPTLAASATPVQQNVSNMNVATNVTSIYPDSGLRSGLAGGNLEFWGGDAQPANASGVPGASDTLHDFGDTLVAGGRGCMQVHDHAAGRTLLAVNNWGTTGGGPVEAGIGNNPGAGTPGNGGVQGSDWTFSGSGGHSTRRLHVFIRRSTAVAGPAPLLLAQPSPRVVPTGGSTTLTVQVAGTGPFTYQWRRNGVAIAGATGQWLDLTNFGAGDAGGYDVVVTGPGGASTVSRAATVGVGNAAPTFAGFAFTTTVDVAAELAQDDLLDKAADPDGGTPGLAAVGLSSAQGGAVEVAAGGVVYQPPSGFSGGDSFPVTITDGQGGSVVGTVDVTVTSAPVIPGAAGSINPRPAGPVDLLFRGVAGREYAVERAPVLGDEQAWTGVATVVAGDDGWIAWTDAAPPLERAFYRTRMVTP